MRHLIHVNLQRYLHTHIRFLGGHCRKQFHPKKCHLAGTVISHVVPINTVLDTEKGDLGLEPPVCSDASYCPTTSARQSMETQKQGGPEPANPVYLENGS